MNRGLRPGAARPCTAARCVAGPVRLIVALLIFYRLAGFYLSRRRRADVGAGGAVTAANGNGRAGRPSSLAAAGDGTLQPGVQS
jgi:hypothetical protein